MIKKIFLIWVIPFSLIATGDSLDMIEKGIIPGMIQNAKVQKADIVYFRRDYKWFEKDSEISKLDCLKTTGLLTATCAGCVLWYSGLIWLGFHFK